MRTKKMFMLLASLMVAGLLALPVSAAAKEESVNLGDPAYQIIVHGFIETRDITVNGETVQAIVAEKPAQKSNGRYDFFEIVTTDPDAVMVTSSAVTADGELGDLMADLENGRLTYSPTLYEDFEELSGEPLYFGFSFRDTNFDKIYEFPVWFVFEGGETSAPAAEPSKEPSQEPSEEPDTTTAATLPPVVEVTAQPTSSKVTVDGKQISFEAYSIDGYNYFKLRDLAMAVTGSEKQFEVTWEGEKSAINLVSGEAYTPAGNELTAGSGTAPVTGITNQSKIYMDGEEVALEAYTINGNNYFKLRDIAAVFNFGVAWDGTLNQIAIDTAADYTE